MSDVARFYDDLSVHYHLLFGDWDESIVWQGEIVQRVIDDLMGSGAKRILDAGCGIGTQALGLAGLGHQVSGSDLSPSAIARAKREAERLGRKIAFTVADFRVLSGYFSGPFEIAMVLDNALPHLSSDEDLAAALSEIASLLAPGGVFLASIRDYDRLLVERPRATTPQVFDDDEGRRVVFQVWDWRKDGSAYQVQQYILRHDGGSNDRAPAESLVFSTSYWPITRARLDGLLLGAGFEGPCWLMPEESGFYQPLVTARLPLIRA